MTGNSGDSLSIPGTHYESLARSELSHFWHVSRVNWVAHLLKKATPDPSRLSVVDIGCGTGGALHLLQQRFAFRSAIGVDASPVAIDRARRLGGNYECIAPDNYAPPPGTDAVLLMDVIEHIEDDSAFLGGLMSRLPAEAFLVISVPALPGLFSDWDRILGHYRRYDRRSLADTLRRSGAEVVAMTYGFSYLLPAAIFRKQQPVSADTCEFPELPPWITRAMLIANTIEIAAAKTIPIPGGTSLFCLARRRSR